MLMDLKLVARHHSKQRQNPSNYYNIFTLSPKAHLPLHREGRARTSDYLENSFIMVVHEKIVIKIKSD